MNQHDLYDLLPVFFQNLAVSHYGRRLKARRYTPVYFETLRSLELSAALGSEEVRDYQLRELRKLLQHCYRTVPYYRESFDNCGFEPGDLKCLEDLRRLPRIDKETVRLRGSELISSHYTRNRLIHYKTSGTTGTPIDIYADREAIARKYAFIWHFRNMHGVQRGEPYLSFSGRLLVPLRQSAPPFWRENYTDNQTLFSTIHLSENNLFYYVERINKKPYSYISGYPSAIFLVADYINRNSIELKYYPRVIFPSSETLLPGWREAIEKAFRCPVADLYGQVETVSQIVQCENMNYHIQEKFGIVDLDLSDETEEYWEGEMVCTGLLNYAMPLINYRTGDFARLYKHFECPCGRSGRVAMEISGRKDDFIITPEGNKVGRMSVIIKKAPHLKECQVVQISADTLRINVVKDDYYCGADEQRLLDVFRNFLGSGMKFEVQYMDRIPRGKNGKFKVCICEVKDAGFSESSS
ncbi:phenylacetate--CoA ligase family protein [bacterium]|nr:phenylacetate--CoA ligase family protein [bacterium]